MKYIVFKKISQSGEFSLDFSDSSCFRVTLAESSVSHKDMKVQEERSPHKIKNREVYLS